MATLRGEPVDRPPVSFYEITDIENLPTDQLAEKVKRALEEGTSGSGRGFVLMPSACPYGRELASLTMKNYEKSIEIVQEQ
jgi:hypothetical protein